MCPGNHQSAGKHLSGRTTKGSRWLRATLVRPHGLLPRPFLRCLHGYGLCLWRLNRRDEAAAVFTRMLWLNPTDNQGMRFLVRQLEAGESWRPER